ncbi:MAG TPA: tripartite tricarboxylate transporter substrate binding protein [Ramlibacter sp.]|nr:tripartite tricarboxylate transporter substrate binding protein [Ramlibacter sp.]
MSIFNIARLFAVVLLAAAAGAGPASAESYPSRPIKLVVGFPPGGINDIVARIVGQKLSESLGQPVVVDNRAGAGGTIGADSVAKAKPDGYTLLLGSVSNIAMAPSQYKALPYDPTKDFTPVALLASAPNILVVNSSLPIKSVKDLIALAKQKPGQISYASAGNGTSNHLTVELLKVLADIDLVHIPYKGDTPAITDVIGGQVPMMFPTLPVALPHIKSGKLRAIAVSSAKPTSLMPGVPTVAESGGLPDFEVSVWVGILAPAGTPKDIVERLSTELTKIVRLPEIKEKLASLGAEPATMDPARFAGYIKSETAKWSKVAQAAKIVPN